MLKAIFFDLDDTLIDHDSAIRDATGALFDRVLPDREQERTAFTERWIVLNREWYKKFFAGQVTFQESGRGKLREAFSIYGCSFEDTEVDVLLAEYWEDYISRCQVFDDVTECLAKLHKYKIGVVTNGQELQQIEKLQRCGILPYLDIVVTSEKARVAKPNAEIFLQACSHLEVQTEESMFVGDNLELDAIAAKKVGMVGIWLNRYRVKLEDTPRRVKRISRLTEISEILADFENVREKLK
ncbi:MAG: HAD family hydrolase [Oscillatoriaceae cyanobacterium Prado104]|jgi:putative hydrolase of the HAD superfamily|nr:HAD family hydrolase [Oscillatoriaceae cyanobacterium Prado104]